MGTFGEPQRSAADRRFVVGTTTTSPHDWTPHDGRGHEAMPVASALNLVETGKATAGRRDRLQLLIRTADFVGAGIGLVLLSPLFLFIACLIRCDSRGPIFFSQQRVGKKGVVFPMLKFRSMVIGAESSQAQLMDQNEQLPGLFKIRNDPRVTRVGKWLRRFSLDELPQLVNVLMGQMSLVGPRPLPVQDLSEVENQYRFWMQRRGQVLPGITGLWQIRGRSKLTLQDMVRCDIEYVDNQSLALNFTILLKTLPAVIIGRGSY